MAAPASLDMGLLTGMVEVTSLTSVELLTRLYVHEHALVGDFEPPPHGVPDPPEGHEEALSWLFGDDYALGMGVAIHAAAEGWADWAGLAEGLRTISAPGLVAAMLRPPSVGRTALALLGREVANALAGDRSAAERVLDRSVAAGFAPRSVERLLGEPEEARDRLVGLVQGCARLWGAQGEEQTLQSLHEGLRQLPAVPEGATDVGEVIRTLVGGWLISHPERYSFLLVPSRAIHPYLVSRVVTDRSAVVIFSPEQPLSSLDDAADLFRVLGHPQRLAILRHLSVAPATGQELAGVLGVSEPTIHHHTSALRAAHLLNSRRDGNRLYHAVDRARIAELLDYGTRVVFGA